MKRKFFSVLLALVLVCSFSLVTAVPAGAQGSYPGLRFQVQDYSTTAVGTASWVQDTHAGAYAVDLSTGTPGALEQVDSALVIFPYNLALSTITELGYSYKLIEGRPANDSAPYMILELDTDANTSADTWVVHHMFVTAAEDTWGTWLLSTDPVDPAWHAFPGDVDYADWAAVEAAFDDDMVLNIKIAVGEWDSDHLESHHVDDFQLDTVTYDLEQPAAVWVATTGDDANPGTEASPFLTIQYPIDILADGIVNVAAGTYAENVVVDKALTLQGATGATVAPTAGIGVEIQASNVTVDGFTIAPSGTVVNAAQGITITATGSGVTISNNTITTVGQGGHGIYIPMSATGLTVTDNNITVSAVATAIYADGGESLSAKNSGWTISGNTLNAAAGVNMELYDVDTVLVDDNIFKITNSNSNLIYSSEAFDVGSVIISNNDFQGNGDIGGVTATIWIESTFQLGDGNTAVDGVTITNNTFDDWANRAIEIGEAADPTGATYGRVSNVVVNYNSFLQLSGNSLDNYTGVAIDAQYNWWGDVAGPSHADNPYNGPTNAATVSDDVDFTPWMIHTELASGWNVFSTPIAPDASSSTIVDALNVWGVYDWGGDDLALYFDPSIGESGEWQETTSLTPLQAVYIKLGASANISVVFSTNYSETPSQTMYAGWNLIGLAELYDMAAEDALATAYYVAGANNIGYGQVVSPPVGQTAWSAVRGPAINTETSETMSPTEGYWLFMVNQGTLAGFTSTPITLLP